MKKYWWIIIVVVVLGALLLLFGGNEDNWIKDQNGNWIRHGNPKNIPQEVLDQISDFNQCVKAGFPIMETYPEQCRLPDRRSFTQGISDNSQ